ncbi:hypothetical protein ACIGD1_17185 [Streptomyces sp. NPDC085612]|uniref:hypothetical protein n=1 Tax=Streptomyces sp. NPDC085612 TaxID=3365732 RepID=UPI0037D34136
MTKKHGHRRTTPSQAPGESGDSEARRQAEEAVVPRTGKAGAAGPRTTGRQAQTRAAKAKDSNTQKP